MPEMPLPALAYLLDCSENALYDIELKSLELSDGCMRRARMEAQAAVAHREIAGVARWLIENRNDMINLSKKILDGKQGLIRFPQIEERGRMA